MNSTQRRCQQRMYLLDTRLNFVPSAYIFSANLRILYTSPWHSASLLPDDQDTNLLLPTSRILCPFPLPFLVDASSPRFPIISHERADFFGRETDGGGRGAPSLSNAIFGNLSLPPSLLPFKKCASQVLVSCLSLAHKNSEKVR